MNKQKQESSPMGEGNPRKISGHWKQRTLALMLAALVLGTGPSAAAQSRDEFSYWDGNGNGDLTCSEALDRDEGLRLPAYKDNVMAPGLPTSGLSGSGRAIRTTTASAATLPQIPEGTFPAHRRRIRSPRGARRTQRLGGG